MKIKNLISSKLLLLILTTSFFCFVVLSWWLLFRDQRALAGFESIYPFFNGSLLATRQFLLGYSLNVLPTVLFALVSITSFAAYFLLLQKQFLVRTVIAWALFFQLITFISYPILSTDIFSYAFSQRVFVEYQENIWLVPPEKYSTDMFAQFADWKDKTNVYGVLNQIIYIPATYLGRADVFSTIVLYKLTVAVFSVASIFVLAKILEDKSRQAFYLKVVFWNPLFLLETVGSGHNDTILLFFILVSFLSWKQKKFALAGIFLALAVQIKLIPIICFGFCALSLLQNKKIIPLLKFITTFFTVTALSFAVMAVSPLVFLERVLYNTSSYWQSLPGLFKQFLPELTLPFTLLFGVFCLYLVYLQVRKSLSPFLSFCLALLGYLFFFTGAYWNWYVLWLLVPVACIKNTTMRNTVLLFSFTSCLAYPLLWFSHRFAFGSPLWPIIQYALLFGVPMGFLGYNYNKLQKDI